MNNNPKDSAKPPEEILGTQQNQISANQLHTQPAKETEKSTKISLSYWLCLGLLFWAVILHVYRLPKAGALWRDEISSLEVAATPKWSEFYLAQSNDSFPLINTFLLRLWLYLGPGSLSDAAANDFYIRIYGTICGLALVASFTWVAISAFRSISIISIALFAISPSVIQWGDSLRAYALGSSLSVLFFGIMWLYIQKPTIRKYALCCAISILMVWTLYGNAFFVLSISVAAAAVAATRRDGKLFCAVMSIGAVSAVSLCFNYPIISEMAKMKEFVAQYITVPLIFKSWWSAWTELSIWTGFVWILAIISAILLTVSKIAESIKESLRSREFEQSIYVSTVLLASLAGFLIYLKIVDIPPQAWYFIPIGAVTAIAIDSLWPLLGNRRSVLIGQTCIAIVIPALSARPTLHSLKEKFTNIDTVAQLMEKRASAGDMILVSPLYQASTFVRYYKGGAKTQVWPPHKPDQLAYQRGDVMLNAIYSKEEAILPLWEEMGQILRNGGKVWIVGDIVVVPADRPPPWVKPGTLFPGQSLVGPYLYTWGAQTFYFLANRAKSASVTDRLDVSQINRWEAIQQVVIFEGWNEPQK